MGKQLSRRDWIDHGLKVLWTEGHEGLKADRMVKALGVTRGSFYWHFSDISAFHTALVTTWRTEMNKDVFSQILKLKDPVRQLTALLERSFAMSRELERGMRRWAGVNPLVAQSVEAVDGMRRGFAKGLFRSMGMQDADAEARAALLMWSFAGFVFSDADIEDPRDWARRLALMFTKEI